MSATSPHPLVSLIAIAGVPVIKPGDSVVEAILGVFSDFKEGDIVVIAQKIVSKSEGRFVRLSDVTPSKEAIDLATQTGRDARFCQVVLDESTRIIEVKGRVIVVEHRSGTICTSAGIDTSNIEERDTLLLLPLNADHSAKVARDEIRARTGIDVAVIVNDSGGSPYRLGSIGEAIGFSGIRGLYQPRTSDLFGRQVSPSVNVVDQISAMASLLMGEACEGTPVVVVRGFRFERDENAGLRDILCSPA